MGHARLVLLLAGLAGIALALPNTENVKNRAFVVIGEKNYFVGSEIDLAWFDAVEFCNALGLSLASIETAEENQLIKDYLNSNGLGAVEFWTSGHRVQGGWLWTGSGQIVGGADWGTGQPDESGGNACVAVRGDGGWFDGSCMLQGNFICE